MPPIHFWTLSVVLLCRGWKEFVIYCSSLLQYTIPCVNLDHKPLIFFTPDRNLAGFSFEAIPNGVVTDMLTNVF